MCSNVPGHTNSPIFLANNFYLSLKTLKNINGAIRAAIVHDNDFQLGMSLLETRRYSLPDEFRIVVIGNDATNQWLRFELLRISI